MAKMMNVEIDGVLTSVVVQETWETNEIIRQLKNSGAWNFRMVLIILDRIHDNETEFQAVLQLEEFARRSLDMEESFLWDEVDWISVISSFG